MKFAIQKKGIETNDEEAFDTIIATGTPYYKTYAIMQNGEEKYYVGTFEEAEKIIADLKEKNSTNVDTITYSVKYSTEQLEKTGTDDVVANLYVAPVVVQQTKTTVSARSTTSSSSSSGTVNTSQKTTSSYVSLGISLIRPVSGTISSKFGERSSIRSSVHTGLDIATSKGTAVVAAAAGTVTYAGYKGSYGNLVVIDHGNGVQTYYAHCNSINCSVGQSVSQGQTISTVGSTGNSTGPHLHLEIRVNGVCYNPQNYLY